MRKIIRVTLSDSVVRNEWLYFYYMYIVTALKNLGVLAALYLSIVTPPIGTKGFYFMSNHRILIYA